MKNQINVVLLEDRVHKKRDELILEFVTLLGDCKSVEDIYYLFELFYDEIIFLTGEKIIEMQIKKNAEILEELKKEYRY
mgnify:CR=1 FL=1|jgi:hypothetical protein